MYGQLEYKPESPQSPWTVRFFLSSDLAPPVLSPQQAGDRSRAVMKLSDEMHVSKGAEFDALKQIAFGMPANIGDVPSALYLALAHLRLEPAHRLAREHQITTTLDAHFESAADVDSLKKGITQIKLMAPLVPDAYLECLLHSQASQLRVAALSDMRWKTINMPMLASLSALVEQGLNFKGGSPEDNALSATAMSLPSAKRLPFLSLMQSIAQQKLGAAVTRTMQALSDSGLLAWSKSQILIAVLRDCLAIKLNGSMQAEIDAVVRTQVGLENDAETARVQAVVKATIAATEAGVPFGPVVQEMNQKAIALAHQVWDDQQLRMTPQRLRLLRKLAQKPLEPKTETSSDTVDIDPVKTWSVSRLLHWIEGPISDASPAPLNRKQIVVRENADRQAARARRKAPPKDSRDDENLTEADVDLAVQNALSATAEFFLLDIQDMLFRAEALNVQSATVSACADLMPLLRDLMNAPSGDDQKARALLHQAETAIQHLRQDVKATEADARTRQKFGECLQNALASEALVEGKRHGGTIACPLHPSDWAWVAEQYHLRGLPWVTRIEVDGVMQPLRPDQAVGLYVTGKSLSGYLFDVSVHLWQRRPGRSGPANVSLTPFSPINAEDWIDTLTPCAVLHVPSAH